MKISSRALKAIMAAAGAVTLGASLFGTALAAAPSDSNSNINGAGAGQQAPAVPDTSKQLPAISNGLMNVQMPKVGTAAFHGAPVDRHDDLCVAGKDDDKTDFGHGNNFQHPCQSKHNSVGHGKAEIAGIPVAYRTENDSDPAAPLGDTAPAVPAAPADPTTALNGVLPNGGGGLASPSTLNSTPV
jgi:hypothetical protein